MPSPPRSCGPAACARPPSNGCCAALAIWRSTRYPDGMSPYIGRSLARLEDERFLTGRGRYVSDIASPGALWGHVLRSPHAHALIKRIDVAAAVRAAGVRGVFTSADLAGLGAMPCLAAVSPLIVPPRFALAVERVRHVGDP